MLPNWIPQLVALHGRRIKWEMFGQEDRNFCALALSGEVGELNNTLKKLWAGTWTGRDPDVEGIPGELADIRIYLELLAVAYGVDLDLEVEKVLKRNEARLNAREKEGV